MAAHLEILSYNYVRCHLTLKYFIGVMKRVFLAQFAYIWVILECLKIGFLLPEQKIRKHLSIEIYPKLDHSIYVNFAMEREICSNNQLPIIKQGLPLKTYIHIPYVNFAMKIQICLVKTCLIFERLSELLINYYK